MGPERLCWYRMSGVLMGEKEVGRINAPLGGEGGSLQGGSQGFSPMPLNAGADFSTNLRRTTGGDVVAEIFERQERKCDKRKWEKVVRSAENSERMSAGKKGRGGGNY